MLLTVRQVAEMAGVSRMTVFREIERGNLPAERVGRDMIIDLADAEVWRASFVKYREQRERPRRRAASEGEVPGVSAGRGSGG